VAIPLNPYRLSRAVVPSAYRIHLAPDLAESTFSGQVEIDVEVAEATSSITLNATHLTLSPASMLVDGRTLVSAAPTLDPVLQCATFDFADPLPLGPATLRIDFAGVLNDRLVGFYRSTYVDEVGETQTIATTQFEHSYAREAFPCWDEPAFKATFQVTLTVPGHLAAYSNSPEISSHELDDGRRTVVFAPTMKMSTYLVAFVVGPFEETPARDVRGTPLRVIYPRGRGRLTQLALESGEFALTFFSDYFDIPYPGNKLDMVAIPDFGFGAMENLGLVTYRESALLVDPERSAFGEKRRVAEIVAHEIAHMWFGDLVTMEWWEGIWLNEAFATFMQILCTDAFHPEWHQWTTFGIDRDMALRVDGLHSTRPIEYEVVSPEDTRGMFDLLTYEKGGSVLRMLEQYLGDTVFRDGIRHYLRSHAYANTKTTDLWDALEEVSGHPVRQMMDTWIYQGGHPLVTLEGGKLSQRPFAYGPARGESAIGETWLVPVLTRSLDGGPWARHLLGVVPEAVEIPGPVVVNAGGSGVFRSRYGADELAALTPRLGELEELERATLVADSYAALLAGMVTWADFLAIARGLGDLDEPTPWTIVATAVDHVSRVLGHGDPRLAAQVRDLFGPQLARLGWDAAKDEGALAAPLRALVISTLGVHGRDEAVRREAVSRFEADAMSGDIARAVLRVVADQDRPGDYETFLERHHRARDPQEELRYLMALAWFNDPATTLDVAERCFSEFRTQDGPYLIGSLVANPFNGPAAWRYLTGRWDEALERFPTSTHAALMSGVATFVTDPALGDEVEAFHHAHPIEGEQRIVEQTLERMRVGQASAAVLRPQF
jgi:puromycin-sensitive aminopeptidase